MRRHERRRAATTEGTSGRPDSLGCVCQCRDSAAVHETSPWPLAQSPQVLLRLRRKAITRRLCQRACDDRRLRVVDARVGQTRLRRVRFEWTTAFRGRVVSSQPCTYGGSTSAPQPCTPVGATSAPEVRATLHLYMCNISGGDLAPPVVQHTLHPRWCNIEYPYLLTHSRLALSCKTDVNLYRVFATNHVDLPGHRGNNRPRANWGGCVMRDWTGSRIQSDALTVPCRFCGAARGERCVRDGHALQAFPAHSGRINDAAKAARAEEQQ